LGESQGELGGGTGGGWNRPAGGGGGIIWAGGLVRVRSGKEKMRGGGGSGWIVLAGVGRLGPKRALACLTG
jgi:hypothetical protein